MYANTQHVIPLPQPIHSKRDRICDNNFLTNIAGICVLI